MHRRALLSAGLTGLTAAAGCLGFGIGSDCPRGSDLRLRPTSDADTADAESDPLETLSPPERDAVVAARRGDAPTLWNPDPVPFADVEYVAADGDYLAVETTVVESRERTGYDVRLDGDSEADASPSQRVAFADLPAVDRTALYALLGYPTTREMERFDRARAVSIGGTLAYPDDEAEADSVLVPDPAADYLRIGSLDFRLQVDGTRPVDVERHRVAVETAADSTSALAAIVYERDGIDFDDRTLSAEQRDIVETAADGGYDECAPYSDAYADLQAMLRRDDGDGPRNRYDYANYEDEWYGVSMSEYVV